MKYLLDVNALIAAIWKNHLNHAVADVWIGGKSLATCPLSELGFLRISTQPKAFGATMADARKALDDFLSSHSVEFVAADLPALQSRSTKSADVTDVYLAELAAKHQCRLATFDTNLSHPAAELMR